MVSILLPISNTEDPKLIDQCLKALAKQTYKDFEVLIVTSKNSAKKISSITKKYPFVKVLEKDLNKTAARNFAVQKAKGEYLLHIDVDMRFPKNLLEECLRTVEKKNSQVIAFGYKELPSKNFWSKCRALERKIIFKDPILESPDFIKRPLFEKIGGYDSKVDPLDDWGLNLTIKKEGVKFDHIKPTVIKQSELDLRRSFFRMFKRGQAVRKLKKNCQKIPQLDAQQKSKLYLKNWRIFFSSPPATLGLIFLKIIDGFSFWLGMLYPKKESSQKDLYLSSQIATDYEKKRLGNNYGRYKHFAECQALFSLLDKESPILEVGCGTGRITAELIKEGFSVIPTDPSEAMLSQFKKKHGLPKPIEASGDNLPFKDNQFPVVLALRVVWHLPPKETARTLSQMSRVSSKFVIFDLVNKKRFFAKLLIGSNVFPVTLEEFLILCQKKGLKLESTIPLDVSLPVWLNLLPQSLTKKFFPFLYRWDLKLAKIIPPGRYLLKLSKTSS